MNLLINCPQHFERTPDGQVWTNGQFPYSFWTRYLAVFGGVTVLARVRDVPELSSERQPASGARVRFLGLPDYTGPRQYALHAPAWQRPLARRLGMATRFFSAHRAKLQRGCFGIRAKAAGRMRWK